MRAVVIKDTSNRTVGIEEVPDPSAKDDEVVVDVRVCGINFTDLLSLDGKYQNNPPPPFTPGKDAAGVVSAARRRRDRPQDRRPGDRACGPWRARREGRLPGDALLRVFPTVSRSMPPRRWGSPTRPLTTR